MGQRRPRPLAMHGMRTTTPTVRVNGNEVNEVRRRRTPTRNHAAIHEGVQAANPVPNTPEAFRPAPITAHDQGGNAPVIASLLHMGLILRVLRAPRKTASPIWKRQTTRCLTTTTTLRIILLVLEPLVPTRALHEAAPFAQGRALINVTVAVQLEAPLEIGVRPHFHLVAAAMMSVALVVVAPVLGVGPRTLPLVMVTEVAHHLHVLYLVVAMVTGRLWNAIVIAFACAIGMSYHLIAMTAVA